MIFTYIVSPAAITFVLKGSRLGGEPYGKRWREGGYGQGRALRRCMQTLAISRRSILAQIMKGDCCGNTGIARLTRLCGNVSKGHPCIDGTLGMSDEVPQLATGVDVRNVLPVPGKVDFDVLFYARPSPRALGVCRDIGRPGLTGLVINIEAQRDFYPGYPLLKRAQYYCAQLLVSQYGTQFAKSHYERLRKVYSIWLCTNPPRRLRGAVGWYETNERMSPEGLPGSDRSAYDLSGVIMVYLDDRDTGRRDGHHGLVNLLSTLFVSRLSVAEKLEVLSREYNIPRTAELEGGVTAMGSFARGLMERSFSDGKAEGRTEGKAEGKIRGACPGDSEPDAKYWLADRPCDGCARGSPGIAKAAARSGSPGCSSR